MEIIIGWLVFSLVAAWIASSKGRSGFGVFVLSVLLSPLIGIIVALVMQRADKIEATQVVHGGVSREFWKCPFCAEAVRFEALKCKHCGSDLSTPGSGREERRRAGGDEQDLQEPSGREDPADCDDCGGLGDHLEHLTQRRSRAVAYTPCA